MKKVITLLLICLYFIGCGDDDQGEALIGTWIAAFQEVSNCADNPDEIRTTNLRCNDATCYRLQLNADGTFSYQQGTLVERGTYSGNFSSLTLCTEEDGVTNCITYSVKENTSATLFIGLINEATECETATFFDKEFEEEESES